MPYSAASRLLVKARLRLAGLLLAAGGSERLGQPKQLVTMGGQSLVKRAARLLLTQTPNVNVVIGAHSARTGQQLNGLPVRIVRNKDWQSGMGGTIACGMNEIKGNFDGVLILLCDQWRLEHQDLKKLVEAWRGNPSVPAVASWKDSFGSPAIFPGATFKELQRLEGERGAKQLISRIAPAQYVDLPNAAFDLDTVEDLEKFEI